MLMHWLFYRSCPTKISDRLIKQSYAVHARLPGESPYRNKRRLHISKLIWFVSIWFVLIYNIRAAYFNAERQKDHLTTDDFPDIRDAIVPRGRFDDPYPDNDPMYKIAFVPSELSITLQSVASQSTPNSPEIRRILDYPLPPLHSIDVHYPRRHPMDELALREFTISFWSTCNSISCIYIFFVHIYASLWSVIFPMSHLGQQFRQPHFTTTCHNYVFTMYKSENKNKKTFSKQRF